MLSPLMDAFSWMLRDPYGLLRMPLLGSLGIPKALLRVPLNCEVPLLEHQQVPYVYHKTCSFSQRDPQDSYQFPCGVRYLLAGSDDHT